MEKFIREVQVIQSFGIVVFFVLKLHFRVVSRVSSTIKEFPYVYSYWEVRYFNRVKNFLSDPGLKI